MTDPTPTHALPELWHWAEFYCPWSYITAVRLEHVQPEYEGRVRLRHRAFPLEVFGGGMAIQREYEQEMWLAALQEPEAEFIRYTGEWMSTTLPAFEAAWAARQMGEETGRSFDLRIRRAFCAQGRNIGRRDVLMELADEAGLEVDRFRLLFESPAARDAVLTEGRMGKERFGVRATPTLMLPSGEKLDAFLAEPDIKRNGIVAVGKLPCCGEGCYQAVRGLFERALGNGPDGERGG